MILGLTGGIGSGKSEASARFELLGIKVVDADLVARAVVAKGSAALTAISTHFGQAILNTDGSLNRTLLRTRIFENAAEKAWLETLLHPIIRTEIVAQLSNSELPSSELPHSKSPYCILSSPLLFETKQNELVNRVLVIDATEAMQVERAAARDTNNTQQIQNIMATQIKRAERRQRADDIIENHGDLNELDAAVKKLHAFYLQLAKQF
jgi:dephospho-CoA kinase